jgi:predicted HNH restriction endonuclease
MRTWLFQCNPDRFQIDRFLATRPAEMNWLVRQHASEIEPGDRVFIWRAIGTGAPEESGVVAECEVLTRTEPMGDNGSVFWADPTEANVIEPRVALRIVHIADKRSMLPRSQLSDDSTLRGLRIFRLRNETNYALSAEEASRLSALWGENIGVGRNPTWVRDELILALDMYLRYEGNPPGKANTEILELSETLNRLARYLGLTRADRFRNANGVYMKLMNFRRFDPAFTESGRVGLSRGGKAEEDVWAEFAHEPDRCRSVAETIRSTLATAPEGQTIEDFASSDIEEAEEGRLITSLHRRYERSVAIVKLKKTRVFKTAGKLACEACEFDFQQRYGERGAGFIECHHTKPPSQLQTGEKTKIGDLTLLCSNCHRMVHARRPWLTIEELKAILCPSA